MHPSSVTLDTSWSSVSGAENWRVPSIRPLETLHNALTLNQMETFLKKMTDNMVCQTPAWSPKAPSTPCLTPKTTPSSGNLSLPFSQGEKESECCPFCSSYFDILSDVRDYFKAGRWRI